MASMNSRVTTQDLRSVRPQERARSCACQYLIAGRDRGRGVGGSEKWEGVGSGEGDRVPLS